MLKVGPCDPLSRPGRRRSVSPANAGPAGGMHGPLTHRRARVLLDKLIPSLGGIPLPSPAILAGKKITGPAFREGRTRSSSQVRRPFSRLAR